MNAQELREFAIAECGASSIGIAPPDDLDAPEAYLEMPVPEANPRPERPKGSPCLELPPR